MSLLDSQASQMVMVHCASCNVPFAIYTAHDRRLRDTRADFYCPTGHCNVYRGKTDLDKAREERDKAREERDNAQRRANNTQAEIERLRRDQRLKKCPHCFKRVIHLSAHVKRAHKK